MTYYVLSGTLSLYTTTTICKAGASSACQVVKITHHMVLIHVFKYTKKTTTVNNRQTDIVLQHNAHTTFLQTLAT